MYCIGSILSRRKVAGMKLRMTRHMIRAVGQRAALGEICLLCILNFVHSSANQIENISGLAPSMTSSHVINHVTWESSAFMMLIET